MAVPLVQITNPNGRKGWVPATHPRLHLFGRPPSTRHPRGDVPPKRNASLSVWRSYAASQGLPGDEAEQMTRDDLVARFTTTPEGDAHNG